MWLHDSRRPNRRANTLVDAHALNGLGGPCCVANLIPLQKKEQVLEILEVVVEQEPGSELISSKFEAMK